MKNEKRTPTPWKWLLDEGQFIDRLTKERDELIAVLKANYEVMIRMGWGCSADSLLRHRAECTRVALAKVKDATD